MVASTNYLQAAPDGGEQAARAGATAADYRAGVDTYLAGLRAPGALERTCRSPLAVDWPRDQATADTFMDNLVHKWVLPTSTGQDRHLAPELAEACITLLPPDRPERRRQVGLVGPAVPVGADASPQDRLVGALGRHQP